MVSSSSAGLIYNRSAFRLDLSCATMREMTRWMNRENELDGGWLCELVETGQIGDNWALSLLKRGLRRTDCRQEKKREIPLFPC